MSRRPMESPARPNEEVAAATRIQHICFITKVFVVGIGLVVIASTQWVVFSFIPEMVLLTQEFNFLALTMLGISFGLMLGYTFLFDYFNQLSKLLTYACIIVTVECATVVMVLPVMTAALHDYICSTVLTGAVLMASIGMTMLKIVELDYTPKDLIVWTMRFYLLTALGILMALACKSIHLQTLFSTALNIMLFFYNLSFGKALGSPKFYQSEAAKDMLYAILVYYNYISFYGNALLFFANMRHFMKDGFFN